ncbi:hypothetical protein TNCV_3073631 [Trichonephila clavipes]|nr:hypothetical protein TNCV_3073631 [Trichonephila clavipes]
MRPTKKRSNEPKLTPAKGGEFYKESEGVPRSEIICRDFTRGNRLEASLAIDTAILSPRSKVDAEPWRLLRSHRTADFERASSPQTRSGITESWIPVAYPMNRTFL